MTAAAIGNSPLTARDHFTLAQLLRRYDVGLVVEALAVEVRARDAADDVGAPLRLPGAAGAGGQSPDAELPDVTLEEISVVTGAVVFLELLSESALAYHAREIGTRLAWSRAGLPARFDFVDAGRLFRAADALARPPRAFHAADAIALREYAPFLPDFRAVARRIATAVTGLSILSISYDRRVGYTGIAQADGDGGKP